MIKKWTNLEHVSFLIKILSFYSLRKS